MACRGGGVSPVFTAFFCQVQYRDLALVKSPWFKRGRGAGFSGGGSETWLIGKPDRFKLKRRMAGWEGRTRAFSPWIPGRGERL